MNATAVTLTGRLVKIARIADDEWMEIEDKQVESIVNSLRRSRVGDVRADVFSFCQKLPDISPRSSYPIQWESVAAIRLDNVEAWWKGLSGYARKDIRRAAKCGVITKLVELDDQFVKGIVAINNECPIRQARRFPHYQDDFDTVKRAHLTFNDRSCFLGAYFNGELIGYMKIVFVGRIAAMMQMLSKIEHYDKRPANALIGKAVEHCAGLGMSYLTYGEYRYRNKVKSSLTQFKRRCGFEEVRVPRFYVPLTAKGRAFLALGLHRGLVEILPEQWIYSLRKVRTLYYEAARLLTGRKSAQKAA